jgi:hypothetical protein
VAADEAELPAFGKAVAAAVAGRTPPVTPPASAGGHDQGISVDAENMTLIAGGGASCRDASAAATAAGLACPAVEADGVVPDIIEAAGNRQPARLVAGGRGAFGRIERTILRAMPRRH